MLLLTVAVVVQASIWPMYRHDTARTGRAEDGALAGTDPAPIWVFPAPENGVSAVDNDFLNNDLDPPRLRQDTDYQGRPLFVTTGAWTPADSTIGPNAYQGDFWWAQPGSGATATWSFPLADNPGTPEIEGQKGALVAYYVYVWFPSQTYADQYPGQKKQATNARYTVEILSDPYPAGAVVSSQVFTVDQTSGGSWMVLSSSAFMVRDDQYIRVSLTSAGADGIVIADGVTLRQDLGSVLSSPAHTTGEDPVAQNWDDLVITCVTENRPLQTVTTDVPLIDENGSPIGTTKKVIQSGAKRVGAVYGVASEDDAATVGKDDRGFAQWNFPFNTDNWIAGGFSASPVTGDIGGIKVAYCPALDGQLYVIRTTSRPINMPDSSRIVWQGPGYIDDDPTAPGWVNGFHPGFQGDDFKQVKANSGGTATWDGITVKNKDEYSIYAWIPPSTTAEVFVSDAKYTITVGAETPVDVTISQQASGGTWAFLGKYKTNADNLKVKVELSNVTSVNDPSVGERWVAADAIKVVPAHLGVFDMSSPAVSSNGERVYIGSTSGRLYCFDVSSPNNHDPVWVYPDPNDLDAKKRGPIGRIEASPTVDGNTIYIGSADGRVYAVTDRGNTCTEKWIYPTPPADPVTTPPDVLGQISSTIAVYGDKLYFGIGSDAFVPPTTVTSDTAGHIVCLNKNTGAQEWVYPDPALGEEARGSFLWSSPLMFDDNTMAIGSSDGSLIGLDALAGRPITGWADGFPDLVSEIYSSPAGVQVTSAGTPMAFVGNQGGTLHGINLRYGTKLWKYGLLGAVVSSPAIAEDRIFVGDMSGITWAFSTRTTGGPGGGAEGWNYDIDPDGPPGDDESSESDILSQVEVDIFRRAEFDAVKTGIELPTSIIADADLHKVSRAEVEGPPTYQPQHNHRLSFPYEWGETCYVIAWSCLDPNDPASTDPDTKWVKGKLGDKFTLETDSTLRLTIKSRGPGDQSDQSTALTMTEKGSFLDTKTGKPVFYAKYAYVLGTSSSSSAQAPGSRITISVQELPSTKTGSINKGGTAGDCVAPELLKDGTLPTKPDPVDPNLPPVYDHAKFQPQRISINNPLGLAYVDPSGVQHLVGVDPGTLPLTYKTDRAKDDMGSPVHDNGNRGNRPWVRGASGDLVAHGTNSDERLILPCDRSLLSLTGNRLSKFRVERNDLEWTGGENQIWHVAGSSTALPWEVRPPLFGANTSLDYPDIRGRQVNFTMAESRLDPTLEESTLRPGGATVVPDVATPWNVQATPMGEVISVPRFQPPNMPMPYNTSDTVLSATGYTGRVYAFIDSNGDGRLNRPGSLGSSVLYQQSVTGARAEAYREFNTQVHVPPDYRVEVGEKTFDIGAVPHGFGLTGGAALPGVFYNVLGDNAHLPGAGTARGFFDQWFKPFTAYNQGNVNLLNVQLARRARQQNGDLYTLDLFSDIAEGSVWYDTAGHIWRPYGSYIPAAAVVSALDQPFLNDVQPIMGLSSRTLHKSTVEQALPTVLRIPDMPKSMYGSVLPPKPFFSVAVPVGTPVGTYSRTLTLFDDMNGNDIYEPNESIGNPLMEAKITVTENRLTDGYLPGAAPQVDIPAPNLSAGDVTPAAYKDLAGNLHMFWSSSRGAASTSWYLYNSSMIQNSGWNLNQPSSYTQWWAPVTTPIPSSTPAALASFFNGGPGTVMASSVKFSSPSIAHDPAMDSTNSPLPTWLFFGGEAVRSVPATASAPETKAHEYKSFYWLLDAQGNPTGSAFSSTRDWTMPKYGVKGAATTIEGQRTLWTFWYGGNNSNWRIYYNANPLPGKPFGEEDSWSNDGRLSLPRGLVSAAEPSIIPRRALDADGDPIDALEVVYSAYSQYHKNADIYLSRYEPDMKAITNGTVELDLVSMPLIDGEMLTRDPASAIFSSRHVDWEPDTDEFEVWVSGPSFATPLRINRDSSDVDYANTRDPQTRARIFTYTGGAIGEAALKTLFRTVIVDTEAGTVKFLRDPGPSAVVTATYRPRAYRLTTDQAADTSPYSLFDGGFNPRYSVVPGDFWFPTPWTGGNATVDRLWVLWRRPSTVTKGTSIYYKSFRYTMQLTGRIAKNAGADIQFAKDPNDSKSPDEPAGPVEIDWAKGRLYFTGVDEGKTFMVTYPDAAGNDYDEPLALTVRLTEELDAHGNSFGNLTSEVANEGQVCAIRDSDPFFSKLWVFWTSTRSGNTDVYYEAICPRFYAKEFN